MALREAPPEVKEVFSMLYYANSCGTPQCVLGNYAARRDLQDVFELRARTIYLVNVDDIHAYDFFDTALKHFDISATQYLELFSSDGCAKAGTPEAAARYIEFFIDRVKAGRPDTYAGLPDPDFQAN